MQNNPQTPKNLSQSKFSTLGSFIAYQAYAKEKRQRQQIESQRKHIQQNVQNLHRQAKKASKQLADTQMKLVQKLNRQSSKQKYLNDREEFRKLKEQQLAQLKNNNSLSRYMNMLKRQEAKNKLKQRNEESYKYLKDRQKFDEKMKKTKKYQNLKNQYQKNHALDMASKTGVELAKVKNFYNKQCQSSIVRNDLMELQNLRMQRQKETIQNLVKKQQNLNQFYGRTTNQKKKYQSLMDIHNKRKSSFMEMYATLQYVEAHKKGNKLMNKLMKLQGNSKSKSKKKKSKKRQTSEIKLNNTQFLLKDLSFD